MKRYLLIKSTTEPVDLNDPEKYVWLNDAGKYHLWNGFRWEEINDPEERIDKNALPVDIVYIDDITEIKRDIVALKKSISKICYVYYNLSGTAIVPNKKPTGGRYRADLQMLDPEVPVTSVLSDGLTVVTWEHERRWVEGTTTYYSMATFSEEGPIIGEWSDPIEIGVGQNGQDGADGRDGVDGLTIEFIFQRVDNYDKFVELRDKGAPYSDPYQSGYVPEDEGWSNHPQGVDGEQMIEAMCRRQFNKESELWGAFSEPTIWSVWGKLGKDGDGIEYIFHSATESQCVKLEDGTYRLDASLAPPRSEEELIAALPPDSSITVAQLKERFQKDEFIPGPDLAAYGWDRGWTDEPVNTKKEIPYVFCSKRKYDGDLEKWEYFSEPVLWSKATYADSSIFTSFAFARTYRDLSNCRLEGSSNYLPVRTIDVNPTTGEETEIEMRWYDAPPAGDADVWVATRIFGIDELMEDGWETPRRLMDSIGFQVEYSSDYDWVNKPVLPSLNLEIFQDPTSPEGVNEQRWRDYCSSHDEEHPEEPKLGTWSDTATDAEFMATCKKSGGEWSAWVVAKVKGEDGKDGEDGQSGTSILSSTYWYKANNDATGITTPGGFDNPADFGWSKRPSDFTLDRNTPFLWAFIKVIYSNETVSQTDPYIVKYFDVEIDEKYQHIEETVENAITADLNDATTRLGQINRTVSTIESENGLTTILNSYSAANKKSFSDIIANAEEATIKAWASSKVADDLGRESLTTVKNELDGIDGKITTAATQAREGAVSDARTEWSAADASITSTATKATYCWVNNEDGSILPYNNEESKEGYTKKVIAEEMSVIQQTANEIDLLVGGESAKAGIQIIADSVETDSSGSKIVLTADKVNINGALTTGCIESNMIKSEAITGDKIAANAITANKIDTTDLIAKKVVATGEQFSTVIEPGIFKIVLNGETVAEFVLDNEFGYVKLRFKGRNGWCDITGEGAKVTYDDISQVQQGWREIRIAEFTNGDSQLIQAYLDEAGYADDLPFDVPDMVTRYIYTPGYKHISGQPTVWQNPATGAYDLDTKPEFSNKIFTTKYYNEDNIYDTSSNGNFVLLNYPSGTDATPFDQSTTSQWSYVIYYFEVYQVENGEMSDLIGEVQGKIEYTSNNRPGPLPNGKTIVLSHVDTSSWDDGK